MQCWVSKLWLTGCIQPMAYFCTTCEQRMGFPFLKGCKKKKKKWQKLYVVYKPQNICYLSLYRKGFVGNILSDPAVSSVIDTIIIPILRMKKLSLWEIIAIQPISGSTGIWTQSPNSALLMVQIHLSFYYKHLTPPAQGKLMISCEWFNTLMWHHCGHVIRSYSPLLSR